MSCTTPKETIIICDKKYDIYEDKEYDYETKLDTRYNIVCFDKSNYIAFAYKTSGLRNDSNFINTILTQQGDSLILTTQYEKSVYGYDYKAVRYYRCIPNGVIYLSTDSKSDFVITKKTAQKLKLKN